MSRLRHCTVDIQELLTSIVAKNRHWTASGQVANYIPELSGANSDALGNHNITAEGKEYAAGDSRVIFTLQSIGKVLSLLCALTDSPEEQLSRLISFEPTADEFNSIANLETKNTHRPLNPMINSGAIATLTLVRGKTFTDKFQRVLEFAETITGNNKLALNDLVYHSEAATGDRNRSLAYYMKSTGVITGDVDQLLDVYFKLCSLQVTCRDVAMIGRFLAVNGRQPGSGQQIVDKKVCHIVKAVMATCGMYNGSGQFAATVGLPAKSGVGGGILAVVPNKMGIGVFGPALDEKGNSIAGVKLLADLSQQLELGIY